MSAIPNLSIDHFGIYVVDLDRMINFYSRVMGFSLNDRGETVTGIEMAFLSRSPEKHHQIVLAAGRSADTPSQINQISFRVDSLADLRRLNEMLEGEQEVSLFLRSIRQPDGILRRYAMVYRGAARHEARSYNVG